MSDTATAAASVKHHNQNALYAQSSAAGCSPWRMGVCYGSLAAETSSSFHAMMGALPSAQPKENQ